MRGLAEAADRYERPAELGDLEISVTPGRPLTQQMVDAYAAAGVHRLVTYPLPLEDVAAIEQFIESQPPLVT